MLVFSRTGSNTVATGLSLLLVFTGLSRTNAGQICASCSNVAPPVVCQHHIECRNDEKCYVHQYTTESGIDLTDLGCTDAQTCPHSLGPVFGKRDESVFGQRDEGHRFKCIACCNDTAICNQNRTCVETTNPGLALPKDCSELVIPNHQSGSYNIYPYGVQHLPVSVYCKLEDNEAWTVIQRRFNGSVSFYQNWDAYKRGFGTSKGEYWLGNDVIHQLTTAGNYKLKIIMTDRYNVTQYAEYSTFRVADESQKYNLSIWGYTGTAGDAMEYHNGARFSTYDRDNDEAPSFKCADSSITRSGWWFKFCRTADLNAFYNTTFDYVCWSKWYTQSYSLISTTMMIRK